MSIAFFRYDFVVSLYNLEQYKDTKG